MGTMTFLTPLKLSAETARELERACVAGGPDSMPWPTRAGYEPGRLTVQRDVDESGYLAVPWEINGVGRIMATTATRRRVTSVCVTVPPTSLTVRRTR